MTRAQDARPYWRAQGSVPCWATLSAALEGLDKYDNDEMNLRDAVLPREKAGLALFRGTQARWSS